MYLQIVKLICRDAWRESLFSKVSFHFGKVELKDDSRGDSKSPRECERIQLESEVTSSWPEIIIRKIPYKSILSIHSGYEKKFDQIKHEF